MTSALRIGSGFFTMGRSSPCACGALRSTPLGPPLQRGNRGAEALQDRDLAEQLLLRAGDDPAQRALVRKEGERRERAPESLVEVGVGAVPRHRGSGDALQRGPERGGEAGGEAGESEGDRGPAPLACAAEALDVLP